MKASLILSAALALTACGGGSDDKDLFSLWTRDGTGTPLDLRGGTFGADSTLNAYTADGTRCICDLAVIGSQQSGSVALTGCISIPFDPGRDPQCKALQGTGTYSKPGDVLTITANGQTSTYR